jgi:ATP-dependent DNA helicase DinG
MTLPKLPSWGEVATAAPAEPAPPAAAVAPARPAKPARHKATKTTAAPKGPKATKAANTTATEPAPAGPPAAVVERRPARFLGDTDDRPARQLAGEILSAAVGIVTGGAASTPRPGQATLSGDVFATMDSISHMVGAAPTGSGKALALDTPIPTPSGWTTMGEIKAGDEVIDETGRPCRVVDAFAVMVDRPCFRLEFSDGASIVADAEHQWVTATRALRFAQAERRRNERRERSIVRMERIEKLEAIASSIADDGYQMTQAAARALLHGLVERSWIAKARKGLSGRNLKKGETFDLRPVLGAIISDLRSRTALASDPPPPFEVTTTEKMAASLRTEDGALNHAVPIAGPLDLPGVELPVEPYVLGAWLGDGSKQSGSITVGYGDLDDMVELLGSAWSGSLTIHRRPHAAMVVMRQESVDLCPWGHNDWRESGTRNNRVCRTCERHPDQKTDRWNECLMEKLRRLDLAHNKHIPQAYLRASIEQRLALLQGLLDTDGTVSEQGNIELSLCDERLAFDAAELIRSLGIRLHVRTAPASITETDPETGERSRRVTGTRFRLTFTTSLPVFRMPRKSRRLADSGHIRNEHKLDHRYLVAAERVPSVPVRCITVDSPNHLFLAGREMVPTHNSLAYLAPAAALAAKRGERTVISTESLTLQGQIVDKDLPTIAAATVEVCGYEPTFAIHKGWSNFACFGPDVEVITFEGLRRIEDLAGTTPLLLDGNGKWTPSPVRSYGEQEIVELTVSRNGVVQVIETTANHRWFVQANANYSAVKETTTEGLRPGDRLPYIAPKNRVLGKMIPSTFGIAAGIVFGDGSRYRSTDNGGHPGACFVQLHGAKNWPLARFFNGAPQVMEDEPRDGWAEPVLRVSGLPSYLKDRPSLDSNTGYLYGWLAGYFAADGSVDKNGALKITSADRSNLEFVTTVCAHLGVDHGSIVETTRMGFPGREPSQLYKLSISNRSVGEEFFLVDEHRQRWLRRSGTHRQHRAGRRWKVEAVVPTGKIKTVYCAEVPTTASFTLAGNILTGNCALRVHHVADLILEQLDDSHDPFNDTHAGLIRMLEALETLAEAPRLDERRISIDRTDFPAKPVVDVLVWALRMIVRRTDGYAHDSGDRDQCPVDIPDALWPTLSTSTGGCIGVKDCTFGDSCLPARSRERASDADIVVTNHALLGIQAAKGVPVVIGSRKLGIFHHIVVDEAHGLPEWVRGAGAAEVSGVRVDRLVSRLERAWDRMAPPPGLFPAGRALAVEVDDHLGQVAAALQAKSKDQRNKDRLEVVLELEPEDDPLIDVQVQMDGWLERCAEELAVLRKILKSNPAAKDQMIAVWRASEAVDSLRGELAEASDPDLDVARWMEWIPTGEGPKAIVKLSPVNVGGLLAGRVWTGKLPDEEAARVTGRPIPKARPSSELEAASEAANATLGISSADHEDYLDGTLEVDADELLDSLDQWGADDGSDETVVEQFYDLSVVTLSATIPNSFPRDAGVRARTDRYPSPFEDAYAGSLLFIPRLTADDPDFERLTSRWSQPDRPKFDTARHPAWAVELMIDMIDANGGSALILSATSAAGQMYAERLAGAARGRWKVRSQWDPMSRSKTIAEWRADRTGVLVGTKSLMTGVDAPGDTCSLVILDRVPRSRNNPVDEARTRTVAEATETDYWSATNATYVSDAATLLEQAAGRLIRSASDRGVFAVLDPRLHPRSGFKMAARDRRTYMAALEAFTQRTSDQTAVRRMLSAEAAAA